MTREEILKHYDLTLLRPDATTNEILALCDKAIGLHCAAVCIPPCYVEAASNYAKNRIKICTVIGFPNGYACTEIKISEFINAVMNGADELDVVVNIGKIKEKKYDEIRKELEKMNLIATMKHRTVKVIIETCLLTEEEKIKMCEIITNIGIAFIKTSTGFSSGGATLEDVRLLKEHVGANVRVKAAGGIRTLKQAEEMLLAGADRIGASRIEDGES